MSLNREIHVGVWTPKSVPYTVISASFSSSMVGSGPEPICCSVRTTRTVLPSSIRCRAWMPVASWRMPGGGSSVSSTSAIRLLLVASQPGKSIPAAFRTTLRPPSQPTRYRARSDRPSASATSTPAPSCANPATSQP